MHPLSIVMQDKHPSLPFTSWQLFVWEEPTVLNTVRCLPDRKTESSCHLDWLSRMKIHQSNGGWSWVCSLWTHTSQDSPPEPHRSGQPLCSKCCRLQSQRKVSCAHQWYSPYTGTIRNVRTQQKSNKHRKGHSHAVIMPSHVMCSVLNK